jgi:acetate kinase
MEIQAENSRIRLLIIATDEEYEIASQTLNDINLKGVGNL